MLTALLSLAFAQGLDTHHPVVPSAGVAHENGPGALWVNPANLSFDPDFRYGLFLTQPGSTFQEGIALPTTTGFTLGAGGVGIGVHNLLRDDGGDMRSDWSVDYATSVQLPERISIGILASWNFIDNSTNYFAYDAGAAWRPLPWLGIAGVAQNVGAPDPARVARPRTAAGLALRPFGRTLILGADVQRLFDPRGDEDQDQLVATARLRPTEGLYFRGSTTFEVTEEVTLATAGGGIEVYFGGSGVQWHGQGTSGEALLHTLAVGSDEPGESIIPSVRRVPVLEVKGSIPYQPRGGLFGSREASWLDTLELMRRVEDDAGVIGFVVHLDGAALSMAKARELRDRILALEEADIPVLVYLDRGASNAAYYVASASSRVAMHPAGELRLIGLSAELMTARGLLDWVGVQPQFVKQGKYKSAPETFTHIEPSEAALEQTGALLDDLYAELSSGIAAGRGQDDATVQSWIDGGPWPASAAKDEGMVDVLLYEDQLDDELKRLHDGTVFTANLLNRPQPASPWEDPKQIAVLYVEGGITSGESSRGGLFSALSTGSDTLVRQLDRAREDSQVRAVVLRVDSPGGSAFASEEIWRAIERLHKAEKPVVVSMGGVAASGGYYVAAGVDRIYAEPGTVTGSIGVYTGAFATEELQEKLGVQTTVLARGRNSTIGSATIPWDTRQRERMQELVDETYAMFKQRVADGRGMELDDVQEVAQGRVWSGVDAKEVGLVDELGGFQDAIAEARRLAGIKDNRKVGLVTYSSGGFGIETLAPSVALQLLGPAGPWVEQATRREPAISEPLVRLVDGLDPLWLQLSEPEGTVWAMDPWTLHIEGTE